MRDCGPLPPLDFRAGHISRPGAYTAARRTRAPPPDPLSKAVSESLFLDGLFRGWSGDAEVSCSIPRVAPQGRGAARHRGILGFSIPGTRPAPQATGDGEVFEASALAFPLRVALGSRLLTSRMAAGLQLGSATGLPSLRLRAKGRKAKHSDRPSPCSPLQAECEEEPRPAGWSSPPSAAVPPRILQRWSLPGPGQGERGPQSRQRGENLPAASPVLSPGGDSALNALTRVVLTLSRLPLPLCWSLLSSLLVATSPAPGEMVSCWVSVSLWVLPGHYQDRVLLVAKAHASWVGVPDSCLAQGPTPRIGPSLLHTTPALPSGHLQSPLPPSLSPSTCKRARFPVFFLDCEGLQRAVFSHVPSILFPCFLISLRNPLERLRFFLSCSFRDLTQPDFRRTTNREPALSH